MRTRFIVLTLCAMELCLAAGCGSLTKDKGSKKDSPWGAMQFWKKEYQEPQKMAALWSHDLLTVAGQPPTRGFGGRLYFYNNKSQTIPVDGELIVHGFDETAKRATGAPENQPDKRFRFTAEQFTSHFSESDLGASYSIWIPWDAADGVQKEITLLPTFRSSKGEVVQGTPAKVVLPGRSPSTGTHSSPIQTVSYEQATIPTASGPLPRFADPKVETKSNGMRTTTIQVPSGLSPRSQSSATGRNAIAPGSIAVPASLKNQNSPANQMLEQARAQLISEALMPAQSVPQRPVQSFNAWSPNTVPMSSSMAVSLNSLQPNSAAPARSMPPAANVPAQVMPQARPADEFGVPPGIQLSPRATAW